MHEERALIRARLVELERTPAWLALKLQVDKSLVHRWLSGERPIPDRRKREIALVLGKSPDWLPASPIHSEPRAAA